MLMFLNGRNTALAVAAASRVPSGSRKPSRCALGGENRAGMAVPPRVRLHDVI